MMNKVHKMQSAGVITAGTEVNVTNLCILDPLTRPILAQSFQGVAKNFGTCCSICGRTTDRLYETSRSNGKVCGDCIFPKPKVEASPATEIGPNVKRVFRLETCLLCRKPGRRLADCGLLCDCCLRLLRGQSPEQLNVSISNVQQSVDRLIRRSI